MNDKFEERFAEALNTRGRVDPGEAQAILDRVSLPSRRSARSGLTQIAAGIVVSAVVIGAVALGLSNRGVAAPVPSSSPTSGSVTTTVTDGTFQLTITADRATYQVGDAITVHTTLTYLGTPSPTDVYGSGSGLVAFSVQRGSEEPIGGLMTADCGPHPFVSGTPVDYPYTKTGGYVPGASDAPFIETYLADPLLHLTAGMWQIHALFTGDIGTCTAAPHTLDASVSVVVTGGPAVSATPAVSQSPSPSPSTITEVPTTLPSAPDCAQLAPDGTADLAIEEGAGAGVSGLNSTVQGDQADTWHQPDGQSAIATSLDKWLRLGATGNDPAVPLCFTIVTADAALLSSVAAQPAPDAIQQLATSGAGIGTTQEIGWPKAAGEWVVRVVVRVVARDGSAHFERRFWRLRIGVDAPAVAGTASKAGTCGTPRADAPTAALTAGTASAVKATSGSVSWRGVTGDAGDEPTGALVNATASTEFTIKTQSGVCAGWWQIELAARPADYAGSTLPLEPFADLVPALIQSKDTTPGSANAFTLGDLPAGDWVVRATFSFLDGSGGLIGQATNYWNVVVK